MTKQQQLKEIDNLILQDIREHPGSTQGQVIRRMQKYYRSRTYIKEKINRLVAIGLIKDERDGMNACLSLL